MKHTEKNLLGWHNKSVASYVYSSSFINIQVSQLIVIVKQTWFLYVQVLFFMFVKH